MGPFAVARRFFPRLRAFLYLRTAVSECSGSHRQVFQNLPSLILLILLFAVASSQVAAQNVTTQQYDNSRDGVQSRETVLTPANVNAASFGKLFSLPVSGHVYAEPLFVGGLLMADGKTHNVVFVATEQDFLYAFDADGQNPSQGYLWKVSLAPAGETFVSYKDVGSGDIYPDIGVTGTPVIDIGTNTLYVVAKSKATPGTTAFVQRLHAISLLDGTEKFNGPTVIQASVPGTGDGNTTVAFNALLNNQRPGLLLAPTPAGINPASVFIAWASHGDLGLYHGWVLAYNASDISQQTGAWCDTPNGTRGGIWLAGGALSSDNSGSIFGASGNGSFDSSPGGGDYGNSAFALKLIGPTLAPSSFFTPADQNALSIDDNDMGVSSMVLLPPQTGPIPHLAVNADKSGAIYLLNADNLGGYKSTGDASLQTITTGGYTIRTSAAFFNNTLYLAGEGGPLSAWSFNPQTETLSTAPVSSSAINFGCSDCGGAGSTPAISANGASNAIVWTLDNSGREKTPAILRAYDAANLQTELYDSAQAENHRDAAAIAVKFTTPVVANAHVYVSGVNAVTVYGLLHLAATLTLTASPASVPQGTSSTLSVAAFHAAQVTVAGSDGSSYSLAPGGGIQTVTPVATTTYTATATNSDGSAVATAMVTVTPAVPSVTLLASPASISSGASATLTVSANHATQVIVTGTDGSSYMLPATGGTQLVSPPTTTTYTATASGSGPTGNATATATITVAAPAPHVSLVASSLSIQAGASTTLTATATNAAQVSLKGSDGSSYALSPTGGTQTVSPAVTTTYTLTATGSGGSASASATVTVSSAQGACPISVPGVQICFPAFGVTTTSPLTVSASAKATSGSIRAIRAYLDNVAILLVTNPAATAVFQVNRPVTAGPGLHRMVVVAYQSNGTSIQSTANFSVSGPAPTGCAAALGTVTICSPTANTSGSSPLIISAGGRTANGYITAMRIYVDGVAQVYAPNPQPTPWFSLAQPVTIANGTRYIVVVAYLSTGAALSLGETVSVH